MYVHICSHRLIKEITRSKTSTIDYRLIAEKHPKKKIKGVS